MSPGFWSATRRRSAGSKPASAASGRRNCGSCWLSTAPTLNRGRLCWRWSGRRGRDGWWEGFRAVLGGPFRDFLAAENAATALVAYAPLQVPALLQTAEYARAVAAADTGVPEEAEELTVTATLTRQQIVLRERGIALTAVIGEAALRQEVGGEAVLRSQLRYLADLADGQCPQVMVQVMPFSAGAQAASGWGEFSVLQFGRVPAFRMVHLAGPAGGTYPEDPDAADAYLKAFDCLRIFALDPAPVSSQDQSTSRGVALQPLNSTPPGLRSRPASASNCPSTTARTPLAEPQYERLTATGLSYLSVTVASAGS